MMEDSILDQIKSGACLGVYHFWSVAVLNGFTRVIKLLIDNNINPATDNNFAIKYASKFGYVEIVRLLLEDPRVDPTVDKGFALRKALKQKHTDIISMLLADSRIGPVIDCVLWWAAFSGKVDAIKILRDDPRANPAAAIRVASTHGYIEIVELLLEKSNISIHEYKEILPQVHDRISLLWKNHLIKYIWTIHAFLEKHLVMDLFAVLNLV